MNQRNVPGIDNAYLAMDTEEGVEVVWNEVMFSERKNFKLQEVGRDSDECRKICLKHFYTSVHCRTVLSCKKIIVMIMNYHELYNLI